MWFMPSYGRPQRLEELLDAPGGWPDRVIVLVNEDDPERVRYEQVVDRLRHQGRDAPWELEFIPAGSRCADAHRWASQSWPSEQFYGLLCDDHWPITPLWHEALVDAAGLLSISGPNGEESFPLLRNVVVLGGELVKAMGSLVPAPVKHNFEDNLWDFIAAEFDILVPLKDVFVEHRHWRSGEAKKDATYERGSKDFENDSIIYHKWIDSDECTQMLGRIAKLLGINFVPLDPKGIVLEIVVPIQDHLIDAIYHKSLLRTLMDLQKCDIVVRLTEGVGGSHIGKAREKVLWAAMRRVPKATHFLWIDSDMGWEPRYVTRMLTAGHDFAAAIGVKKNDKMDFCVNFLKENEIHPRTGFLKVRDVGFAFVMMKREVVERMFEAYPELRYGEEGEAALFLDMIDEGQRLSEDFSFCRRWRAIGGDIWVDIQAALIHSGMKHYTGKLADLFEREPVIKEADAA